MTPSKTIAAVGSRTWTAVVGEIGDKMVGNKNEHFSGLSN